MNIVGIAACTAGIAHTYIAREKIINSAKEKGHQVAIETQGLAGTENRLTDDEIKNADVILIAADIKVNGRERFKGKKIIEVTTNVAVKSPNKLIEKLEEIIV